MDKNTLIVLGFLLLCILLSLDEREGFATINISEFETACNADGTTCIVEATGARGENCLEPGSSVQSLYNLLPGEAERDLHKETFNITTESCSDSAYNIPGQSISAQVCSNEGQAYTLSGCAARCTNETPGGKSGYDVSLPLYISPIETDSNGIQGIINIEGSCNDGLLPAINTCFNKNGTINGSETLERCTREGGIWYDDSGNNSIKLVCDTDISSNYSVIGCEPACYSRVSDLDEYMTTSDLSNQNKEIIQILHRTNPSTSDNTEIIMPQSSESPYLMTESSRNPGAFSVTGTNQPTNFSPGQDGTPIPIDFAGVVESSQGCNLSSQNTDLQRKYPVSGLFPACDSSTHECLNFNITYDSVPTDKLNITDFKSTMDTSAGEIGIPDNELDNYKNSLYYYRRYKDTNDKVHIEGQIRCNNDPSSPFHCIITDPSPWYWKPIGRLGGDPVDCNSLCSEAGLTCTTGDIDISEGDNPEEKMRNVISRLNLVDPSGYLEMINGYSGNDPSPAGLNFNNFDDTCVSHGNADTEPVDLFYNNPPAYYANVLNSSSLPFGFISKEQSGRGVGHSCFISQNTDTFRQSCDSEWENNFNTDAPPSPICHCSLYPYIKHNGRSCGLGGTHRVNDQPSETERANVSISDAISACNSNAECAGFSWQLMNRDSGYGNYTLLSNVTQDTEDGHPAKDCYEKPN